MLVMGDLSQNVTTRQVWEVSLGSFPTWRKLAVSGTAPPLAGGFSATLDPIRDRVLIFGGGPTADVYTLELPGTPRWSVLAASGTPPAPRQGHVAVYDPRGDRLVIFGGDGAIEYDDAWALSLAGTPTWSQIPVGSSRPHARGRASAIFDPRRVAMIVFGGLADTYPSLPYALSDAWSLSLSGPATWTRLPDGPSARSGHGAIYDAARDRMVVLGGAPSEAWAFEPGPRLWTRLAPSGANSPAGAYAAIAFDPAFDRAIVHGGSLSYGNTNNTFALNWGPRTAPTVECPGGIAAIPGTIVRTRYVLGNTEGDAQDLVFVLDSDRAWPSFPLAGSQRVGGFNFGVATIGIPIPDTAAAGSHTLTFRVFPSGAPELSVSCTHTLAGPTDIAVLSFRSAEATAQHVRLVWEIHGPGFAGGTVYRRDEDSSWDPVGRVRLDSPERVSFEDTSVEPGRRYGYRVQVATSDYETVLGQTWVDVPPWSLVLTAPRPNPATGFFDVAFSLAGSAVGRLEVFDIAGRRKYARDLSAFRAGPHVERIDPVGWPAGVYVIRLTQGGTTVVKKACLLR